MKTYNSAKSTNTNYWVSLRIEDAGLGSGTEGDEGLIVITDMLEQTMMAVQSS